VDEAEILRRLLLMVLSMESSAWDRQDMRLVKHGVLLSAGALMMRPEQFAEADSESLAQVGYDALETFRIETIEGLQ